MVERTKVAIVNAGGHRMLNAERGDYDSLVKSMQALLERAERNGEPPIEVSTVRSTGEALQHVGHRGVIFYVTMGMADEAEKVQREHSQIRVVVLSGEPWKGGVIYLPKSWVTGKTFELIARHGY